MSTPENTQLTSIADDILTLAKKGKAAACAVRVGRTTSRKVVHRDGQWEELQGSTTQGATVRLFVDGRYAVHRTSDLRPESLATFLAEAIGLTRQVMPDPHRKLPEPALYAPKSPPDLQLADPAIAGLTLERRKQAALAAHQACREKLGDKGISVAATFSDAHSQGCIAHSDGFAAGLEETSCTISSTAAVMDPGGGRPSDWAYSSACHLADLVDPAKIGTHAGERALRSIGARKIDTGHYELIIENRACGHLLGGLLEPLYGSSIFNKRSWAADLAGSPVGAAALTITDDPLVVRGLGSRAYDGEGLGPRRLPVFEGGVLRGFYIDTYHGSRLGRAVTTGSPSNLVVAPGVADFSALLSSVKRGLWINRFIGGNNNSTTGDFSMGLGGFLVENGRVASPVIELNLSANHRTFWQNLVAAGSDVQVNSSTRTPSLLFRPVLIAGK
jgi:PmbA protein